MTVRHAEIQWKMTMHMVSGVRYMTNTGVQKTEITIVISSKHRYFLFILFALGLSPITPAFRLCVCINLVAAVFSLFLFLTLAVV